MQQKFALLQIVCDSTAYANAMLVEKLVEKDKISIVLLWVGGKPNGLNFSESQ